MTSEEYKVALAEALRKLVGIMPVGAEWCRAIGKGAPKGGIAYLGQSVTRAMYSDLWDYVQTELADSLIEESEWQTLFTSQNGNVPYYSKGDGSTTFRMPCISGYIKGAKGVSEVGQYTPEGLPDASHTHTRGTMNITGSVTSGDTFALFGSAAASIKNTGALYSSGAKAAGTGTSAASYGADLYLDASRSWTGETSVASLSDVNPIYGNSTHVTPETVAVLFGVYAIGTVVSIGEATEEGILAELGALGVTKADASELAKYLPLTGGTVAGHFSIASAPGGSEGGELHFIGPKGPPQQVILDTTIGTDFRIFGTDKNNNVLDRYILRYNIETGRFLVGNKNVVTEEVFFAPNYNAGVSMGTTFTAPSSGIVNLRCADYPKGNSQITVNGTIATQINIPEYVDRIQTALVRKGDSVTVSGVGGAQTVTFYPFRGA